MKLNKEMVQSGFKEGVKDLLRGLAKEEDLKLVVEEISVDFAEVALTSDPDERAALYRELEGQLELVFERHRIRVNKAIMARFRQGLKIVFNTVMGLIVGGIKFL